LGFKGNKNNRIYIIDFIRGITVISMILYHMMWDIVYSFGNDISWYKGSYGHIWQQSICITFIIISGFCLSMDKRPVRNSIILLVLGYAITLITSFMGKNYVIYFGVLSCIGTLRLLTYFLRKFFKAVYLKIHKGDDNNPYPDKGFFFALCILSLLLFIVNRDFSQGEIFAIKNVVYITVPVWIPRNIISTFLGLPYSGFYSADYFPVFPWMFIFWVGYFLYKSIENTGFYISLQNKSEIPSPLKPFCFIGRNSLIFYLLHQPIIFGLLSLINILK